MYNQQRNELSVEELGQRSAPNGGPMHVGLQPGSALEGPLRTYAWCQTCKKLEQTLLGLPSSGP